MAKVTPVLRTSKANAKGHCPLWLRISHRNDTTYVSLGVWLPPRQWNPRERRVRKGYEHADRINRLVAKRVAEVEDERLRLLCEGVPVTAEALKAAIAPKEGEGSPTCFVGYVRAYIEELERRGNVGRYRRENAVLRKLEAFAGTPLPFERVTPPLLRAFEAHLFEAHANKASTAQGNMKVLRTHFRRAIKEGVVSRESDPFFAYSPPSAERASRYKLTDKEVAAVEGLDLGGSGPKAPTVARVRDAFLLALYAAGMRFGDVARLRRGDITEEKNEEGATYLRLRYTMWKTKRPMSLRLVPKAERIARAFFVDAHGREKPPGAFLFPMLEGYDLSTPKKALSAVGTQNSTANAHLREIGEQAGVTGHLTFHVARHSFADLARRSGRDVYAISKSLGHGGLGTTQGYLAEEDQGLVDEVIGDLFTWE